mmetsp:Transcript_18047/g.38828  ORF Transcript_18047/g.38828 Transcript_18047/m.38828 type:complete len:237 (+) Transcript_18047:2-712(+)
MDLLVRKRMAIEKWKAAKQESRSKQLVQAALLDTNTAMEAGREHQDRAQRDQHQEAERQVQKEMVRMWKEQQEARQQADREAAEARRQEEGQRQRIVREERQNVNKMKLELHRQVKDQVARQQRAQAEAAAQHQAVPDPAAAWRVQQRTNAVLKKRHDLLASKETKLQQRTDVQRKLLAKVKHEEAARDPARLLKGTAAHMQRVEAQRKEEAASKDSAFILHVSHRAAPSWRAGLT